MQVAGELFGYDLGEADLMRRAVSKKKAKALKEHKDIFMERGPDNGIPADVAEAIFDEIEFFANYGFNKCLVGSTEIVDPATGYVTTIDNLYKQGLTISQAITLDTEKTLLKVNPITDVIANGKKPVFKLTTRTGREITATANHPFFVDKHQWKWLQDLEIGERIAVPRKLDIEGMDSWEYEAIKALAIIAVSGNNWQFTRVDFDTPGANYNELLNKAWISQAIPENGIIQELPSETFSLSLSQLNILIAEVFALKGRVNREHPVLTCHFTSSRITKQFQHLLLRFGIVAKAVRSEDAVTGTVTGKLVIDSIPELIAFLKTFKKNIRYNYGTKEMLDYLLNIVVDYQANYQQDVILNDDIYWDTVISKEYVGEEPTYDLTIEDTHNFVANDIIVHNSHASDYAVITVQTAFLKCHYPAEYMTALLSVQFDNSEKVATFLEECRRLKIPVLPPNVNYSAVDFDIEDTPDGNRGIRFGMGAIKNASVGALHHIIEERNANGTFNSLADLCHRVDLRQVGKRTVESLIKVGASR